MEDTLLAKGISHAIMQRLGQRHAILAVVLSCAILTYGGVSLFVVVFAVYPFAAALFKEADIPKRLIPGCIALGAFTFTMDAFPGTPQIQNIIPTSFYGTTGYAAPVLGLLGGTLIFVVGMVWLEYRRRKSAGKGEGYGPHTLNEPPAAEDVVLPKWYIGMLPLLAVLALNFILSRLVTWDPQSLAPLTGINLPLLAPAVKNVIGTWSLIIALVAGIVLALALGYKNMPKGSGGLQKALNVGAIGSLLAIMNTASEVGYGNVIAALPGFKSIAAFLLGIKVGVTPLVSEAVSVTTLAGITGSASGGMSIALDLMSKIGWRGRTRFTFPGGSPPGSLDGLGGLRHYAPQRSGDHPACSMRSNPQAIICGHRDDDPDQDVNGFCGHPVLLAHGDLLERRKGVYSWRNRFPTRD